MSAYIARFNPYSMDDETILAVATGRKQPLRMVLDDLEEMLQSNGETTHLLVSGPRGIGKSFFARYLEIQFKRTEAFQNCRFILFPEEQSNIHFPGDFVRMLLSQTEEGGKFEQVLTKWEESEAEWKEAYGRLRQWIQEQREQHDKFLLVALVENMDELMQRFSGVEEGRFREMLEKLPCFVLIGATPKADFDRDYNRPLFHAFKKYKLFRWKEEDFLKYFTRRRQVEEERTGVRFSPERIALMENKLRAISLFTGGSPRMAAVLSNLLLKDDLFSTANTLRGLVDELTPYYQDLTKSIPTNSRKLFDTLIRAGENLSQTELASKLGTSQSTISKAFLWLQENDYIRGEKRAGSPSYRYLVNDRIFCLYYKTREVLQDQDYSPVWLLADLLVAYYEEDELSGEAIRYLEDRFDNDTKEFARLTIHLRGIPRDLLPKGGTKEYWTHLVKEKDISDLAIKIAEPVLERLMSLTEKPGDSTPQLVENALKEIEPFLAMGESSVKVANRLGALANVFLDSKCPAAALKILDLTSIFWKGKNDYDSFMAGRAHGQLGNYVESIRLHEQALFLEEGNDNRRFMRARNLGAIGINLFALNRYEEAIDSHNQAVALHKEDNYGFGQAWNIGQIGCNLQMLGRFQHANDCFWQAFSICKEDRNKEGQVWCLGHVGANLFQLGKGDEAWEFLFSDVILPTQNSEKEKLLMHFSSVVFLKVQKGNFGAAFGFANDILRRLAASADRLDVVACLVHFFAGLINRNLPKSLFQDICEEALVIFPSPQHQIIIKATLSTVEYVAGGKQKTYLEKLPPDMAAVVEAIVKEGEL